MTKNTYHQTRFILNNLSKNILEEDYKNLKTLGKISKKYNVSQSSISNLFKKYNIEYNNYQYKKNENIFSEESERSFYLAGFIAADGCIRISNTNKKYNSINYRIVIALSKKDLNFLEKLRILFECENPIGIYNHKLNEKNNNWNNVEIAKFQVSSKKMITDLEKFGIFPRKTFTYKMTDWLYNHEMVNHFIRGYIDGDGSFFYINTNTISQIGINCGIRGTLDLLNQVKNLLELKTHLNIKNIPKIENGIGNFKITSTYQISKIYEYLYNNATIFMNRKEKIASKAKQIIDIKNMYKAKLFENLNNIINS